jgi:hypothetical protein
LGSTDDTKIVVTKLEAARRQLKTAIKLWFEDGDPVAVHTLIAAAYEILDTLARRHGAVDLLFAPDIIKDEFRTKWVRSIKSPANFFKHADRDPDGTLEFPFIVSEMFMFFSCNALIKMGETVGMEETAMLYYFMFSHPDLIREDARKNIPAEVFEEFNSVRKRDFLNLFSIAWRRDHVKGAFTFDK